MTSTEHDTVQDTHPLDDVLVLRHRPLREGVEQEQTARFRDDIWSLTPAIHQQHQQTLRLNFTAIPIRYRLVTKELFHALLAGELPAGEQRLEIISIRTAFTHTKRFLTWLNTHTMATGSVGPLLTEVAGQDLLAYQRYLTGVVSSADTRADSRRAVRRLWRFGNSLGTDRLAFDPNHVEGWNEVWSATAKTENSTARIPEQVHSRLLIWALRFIDFAPDIVAANHEWERHRAPAQRNSTGVNCGVADNLRRLLDEHLAQHRPLPGHRGNPNLQFLARELGCHRSTMTGYLREINAAAAAVGVASDSCFHVPITGRLDGRPWVHGIASDHTFGHGLATLARMLQAACYITVAFLSGMRDGEIKHLQRGCLHTSRDTAGRPYRWRVSSLAFKGENDVHGVPATWVVGAPAARAITVLEQLQPARTEWLFAVLPHTASRRTSQTSSARVLRAWSTNLHLNEFVSWVNTYCAEHNRTDGIPPVDKQPWKLSTRQFRRTLAWFIARRPGGVIAGAIAYRHLSVQMFEGYAGTSDSGFRAEVESEQALARGEHLLAMIDKHEHTALAGPAAAEAAFRLDQFGEHARYQGTVITDERRLKRLMQRGDPAVYPGRYVTCVHKHETALCQQHRTSRGQLQPDLGDCQPLLCRNVALTIDNLDTLNAEARTLDRRLNDRPPLPPLMAQQLRTRRDDINNFLIKHTQDRP